MCRQIYRAHESNAPMKITLSCTIRMQTTILTCNLCKARHDWPGETNLHISMATILTHTPMLSVVCWSQDVDSTGRRSKVQRLTENNKEKKRQSFDVEKLCIACSDFTGLSLEKWSVHILQNGARFFFYKNISTRSHQINV